MDTENVPTDTQLDPTAVEGDEAALEMHWNIATFLPEVLSDHFKAIIGEFIVSLGNANTCLLRMVQMVGSVLRRKTKTKPVEN